MFVTLLASLTASTPIIVRTTAQSPAVVDHEFGTFTCDDMAVKPTELRKVRPGSRMLGAGETRIGLTRIDFSLAANGRPTALDTDGAIEGGEDVLPALAASRFAAASSDDTGVQRRCSVAVNSRAYAPESVPPAIAARYLALLVPGRRVPGIARPYVPEGATCPTDRPQWLVRAQPDFSALEAAPGSLSHVYLTYDVDEEGQPLNIRVRDHHGTPALAAAATAAMEKWRFVAGSPRTGCSYSFWRRGDTLVVASPASKSDPDDCPDMTFAQMPSLPRYFPDAFRARAIEGSADLTFDAAPWGELGNIEIVGATPAAAFGEAGKALLSAARLVPSSELRVSCPVTIRFSMDPDEGSGEAAN